MRTVRVVHASALKKVPFVFFLLLVAGFVWFFGDYYFPNWIVNGFPIGVTISYYFVLIVIFLVISRFQKESLIYTPLSEGIKTYSLGFLITLISALLLLTFGILIVSPLSADMWFPTVVLMTFIVAPAEELMFRNSVQYWVGPIYQAVIFALFHVATYGIVWRIGWPPFDPIGGFWLMSAFAFGLLMGLAVSDKRLGLPFAIGAHTAWNLVMAGALVIL